MRLAERSRSGHRSISKEVAARNMHVRILLPARILSSLFNGHPVWRRTYRVWLKKNECRHSVGNSAPAVSLSISFSPFSGFSVTYLLYLIALSVRILDPGTDLVAGQDHSDGVVARRGHGTGPGGRTGRDAIKGERYSATVGEDHQGVCKLGGRSVRVCGRGPLWAGFPCVRRFRAMSRTRLRLPWPDISRSPTLPHTRGYGSPNLLGFRFRSAMYDEVSRPGGSHLKNVKSVLRPPITSRIMPFRS
jgi:hypothetical protein